MQTNEILETIKMIDEEYLDIRTITMGISLLDCMDPDIHVSYQKVEEKQGILVITADHGNCDIMINEDGTPCTTHTTNKVPFIVTKDDIQLKDDGKLADIAPTLLHLLKIPVPVEMDGESLIK